MGPHSCGRNGRLQPRQDMGGDARSPRRQDLSDIFTHKSQRSSHEVFKTTVLAPPHPNEDDAENYAVDNEVLHDDPDHPAYPGRIAAFLLRLPLAAGADLFPQRCDFSRQLGQRPLHFALPSAAAAANIMPHFAVFQIHLPLRSHLCFVLLAHGTQHLHGAFAAGHGLLKASMRAGRQW